MVCGNGSQIEGRFFSVDRTFVWVVLLSCGSVSRNNVCDAETGGDYSMQTTSDVSELLGGYAKSNLDDLSKLTEGSDWQALAKWETTRRAAKLLELFDDQTVAAIASGEIDMNDLCKEAVERQRAAS
jgi:hypothetical protein